MAGPGPAMVEREITAIPPLTPAERSVVESHSLLNLYNVVRGELTNLGVLLAENENLFAAALDACDRRVARVAAAGTALADAVRDQEFESIVHLEIEARLDQFPARRTDPEVHTSISNLDSFLWILHVRTLEFSARAAAPGRWVQLNAADLVADFQEWFRGLEQFSHGRLHFVYNLALQGPRDTYVDLCFEGRHGGLIRIPAVLKDVLRDLVANARKYTAPGGQLRAALHCGADGVRIAVDDTGRGIPAEEIESVVGFGRRGSNVGDVRSLGAGCGLTKAFLVTRELGGRFWIASAVGRGTRVRLHIPPESGTAAADASLLG